MKNSHLLITAFMLFSSTNSFAALFDKNGLKIPDIEVYSDRVNWERLNPSVEFNGVGQYDYRCTTVLINQNSSVPDAPVYALTNAHCVSSLLYNPSIPGPTNQVLVQPVELSFNAFFGINYRNRIEFKSKKVPYIKYFGTDLAILQVETDRKTLKEMGITTYSIANEEPLLNEPIKVVGVLNQVIRTPHMYIANPNSPSNDLHLAQSYAGEKVYLKEGEYYWSNAIRFQASIIIGFSGSPIFNHKNEISYLVNTGVADGTESQPACSDNKPCELKNDGTIEVHPEFNYGVSLVGLNHCFEENGVFNLHLDNCPLPK